MHFNLYIDNLTGEKLNGLGKTAGKSRNALIRMAIDEWIDNHGSSTWPAEVQEFTPDASFSRFESTRSELGTPMEDPFAE